MATFNSISDLGRYYKTSSGQTSLMGVAQVQTVLERQAKRLKDCIQKRINDYYSSYSPSVYNRTYGMQNSMYLDDNVEVNAINGMLTIDLHLDDDGAYGTSLFGGGTVDKLGLMNYGWQTNGSFKDVYRFGNFDGAHFIEDGISDWKSGNTEGVYVISKPSKDTFRY